MVKRTTQQNDLHCCALLLALLAPGLASQAPSKSKPPAAEPRSKPTVVKPSEGTKGPFHDLKVAMGLITKARIGAAKSLLEKVVKEAPSHAEAWQQLAVCAELQNDAPAAQRHATAALKLDPKHARAALLLARLSVASDPLLASDYARQAAANAGPDVAVQRDAAQLLLNSSNVDEAHAIAERLGAADPTNQRLLTLRSEIAIARRDFEAAQKHLKTLVVLRPGDPLPLENLAGIAWTQGDRDAAIAALEHALRRRPKREARVRLIAWLEETGAPQERIAREREALRASSGAPADKDEGGDKPAPGARKAEPPAPSRR